LTRSKAPRGVGPRRTAMIQSGLDHGRSARPDAPGRLRPRQGRFKLLKRCGMKVFVQARRQFRAHSRDCAEQLGRLDRSPQTLKISPVTRRRHFRNRRRYSFSDMGELIERLDAAFLQNRLDASIEGADAVRRLAKSGDSKGALTVLL